MKKSINKYSKLYKDELIRRNYTNVDTKVLSYEQRLSEMYASEIFIEHNNYPSMDVVKIYAVIAMCLELKQDHLSNEEIIDFINGAFEKIKKLFKTLENIIDSLPICYKIAKKWNISDYENRCKDGSITYDQFEVSKGKIEYRISKCMYIEIFEYYGIRKLCKIFCITDEQAYSNLTRHVKFIRHSDMSNGDICHDEIIDKKSFNIKRI